MTDWRNYLNEAENKSSFKKKKTSGGCKRNRITKNKNGPCVFDERNLCMYCKRPRRHETRLDPKTGNITTQYFE